MKTRYKILAETSGPHVRTVSTLFETPKRHEFDSIKAKIEGLGVAVRNGRTVRGVDVLSVDWRRLHKFAPGLSGEIVGNHPSVRSFAKAIKANPASVRVALSKAKHRAIGNDPRLYSMLRGVMFRYSL